MAARGCRAAAFSAAGVGLLEGSDDASTVSPEVLESFSAGEVCAARVHRGASKGAVAGKNGIDSGCGEYALRTRAVVVARGFATAADGSSAVANVEAGSGPAPSSSRRSSRHSINTSMACRIESRHDPTSDGRCGGVTVFARPQCQTRCGIVFAPRVAPSFPAGVNDVS